MGRYSIARIGRAPLIPPAQPRVAETPLHPGRAQTASTRPTQPVCLLPSLTISISYLSVSSHLQGAPVGAPLRALTDHIPFPHSSLLRLGIEVVSPARIQRGPSEAARWASTETTSVPNRLPSLPPRHFISLLLQAPVDEIRVGLSGV
jgi:hypothetical protein